MGKCCVCGKIISDFSEKCPYCGYARGGPIDANIYKTRERLSKKNVLISFTLNLILLAIFRIFRVPEYYFSGKWVSIFEIVLYTICAVYAIAVVHRQGVIAHLRDKIFLGFAIVIVSLLLLISHVYCVRFGSELSWRYVFSDGIVYGLFFIIRKIMLATMWTITLIDIRFLLFKRE